MIRFECIGITGYIDEYGFMRWGSMGAYLSDFHPSKVLFDSVAKALIQSNEVDQILTNWFDIATTA